MRPVLVAATLLLAAPAFAEKDPDAQAADCLYRRGFRDIEITGTPRHPSCWSSWTARTFRARIAGRLVTGVTCCGENLCSVREDR